jgi:Protein of unknown function (DUF2442)
MSTSATEAQSVMAQAVNVTEDALTVDLTDGRVLSVPLAWYPRLLHGTPKERNNWRFIGGGVGIHWPDLDEDISIEGLLLGAPSGESQRSFKRWLDERNQPSTKPRRRPQPVPTNGGKTRRGRKS